MLYCFQTRNTLIRPSVPDKEGSVTSVPYQQLTENTRLAIRAIPICIPSHSHIAGPTLIRNEYREALRHNDNLHFPMGTAYLEYGVPGVAALARQTLASCESDRQRGLLSGIAAACDEIAAWFARYVPALDRQIASAETTSEKSRLSIMRENMAALSAGRPQTFPQAVQLMYLMWRLHCAEANGSIGRLDMHLLPFYQADVEQGRLTDEEALFWICQLWERINECGSGDTLIQLMLGGQDEQGQDVSNPLSLLMLRATRLIRKTEPHINLRVHKNTPSELLEEAYRVQLMGHGQATFYNDDVIISSLVKHGVPREYACRYANNGCTEIVYDGLSAIDFNHIDAVAAFELALNNGTLTPKKARPVPYFHKDHTPSLYQPDVILGFESGNTDQAETFADFYEMFLRQYRHQLTAKLELMKARYLEHRNMECSLITNGSFVSVLESGYDLLGGGLPMTDYMTFLGSIPTVADCLAGVKHAVYEQKLVDMPTLKKALAANFQGYEALRSALLAAPKFGNDIDEVDLLAADIMEKACGWADDYSRTSGLRIWAATVGWRFVEEAYGVGATPDGRLYGDPISEHYCATPGKATHGPTALLHSITKAPLHLACGVAAAHVSLPASVSANEEAGLMTLRTLNTVARQRGIFMLNIAIYDVDSLKKAQCRPEDYQDLIVRVWGFSARFVDLSREMQDHVISRILKS